MQEISQKRHRHDDPAESHRRKERYRDIPLRPDGEDAALQSADRRCQREKRKEGKAERRKSHAPLLHDGERQLRHTLRLSVKQREAQRIVSLCDRERVHIQRHHSGLHFMAVQREHCLTSHFRPIERLSLTSCCDEPGAHLPRLLVYELSAQMDRPYIFLRISHIQKEVRIRLCRERIPVHTAPARQAVLHILQCYIRRDERILFLSRIPLPVLIHRKQHRLDIPCLRCLLILLLFRRSRREGDPLLLHALFRPKGDRYLVDTFSRLFAAFHGDREELLTILCRKCPVDAHLLPVHLPAVSGKCRESLRQCRGDLGGFLFIAEILHGNIEKLRASRMRHARLFRQTVRKRRTQKSLPAAFCRKKAGEKSDTKDKKKSESHKKPRIGD